MATTPADSTPADTDAASSTDKGNQTTSETQEKTTAEQSSKEEWEIQRDHHKQLADQAFRCGGFKTAIDEYSKAIALDPEKFVVAYSNRSAAYLKNGEKSKALHDAETVVRLDPSMAKGHSRLAAALHALRRYRPALEAYQAVLKLDAGNAVATRGVKDCEAAIAQIEEHERQHMQEEQQKEETKPASKEASEEQNPEQDEGDDLLDEFFADVEEATEKKKPTEEAPKATNAVKNDKQILGTTKEQMDRLLHPSHEWRNLNPFFVLQLPTDADEDDIARRYKALSLMLHPDKNRGEPERAQQAFDEVKKAKTILGDADRAKHVRQLAEEGMKQGQILFKQQPKSKGNRTLEELQETEVMRIFAHVEQKRRDVQKNERKYEQRTQQQEDDELEKERKERQFDKSWRKEERVDKRVGNWRDFAVGSKKKKKKHH